jgi:hypothetical protein
MAWDNAARPGAENASRDHRAAEVFIVRLHNVNYQNLSNA